MNYEMPQFQTDYLISWDFTDPEHPCVKVMMLDVDETQTTVLGHVIGVSEQKCGVISLQQLLSVQPAMRQLEQARIDETIEELKGIVKENK